MGKQMQIGEVAERTGLSLRTIRYWSADSRERLVGLEPITSTAAAAARSSV